MLTLASLITGELTKGELLTYSLLIAVVGVTVVFTSLFVITVFVLAFTKWMRIYENYKKYLESKKRREARRKRRKKVSPPELSHRAAQEEDTELAALVAAAYCALSGSSRTMIVKRVLSASNWRKEALSENFLAEHRTEIKEEEEEDRE